MINLYPKKCNICGGKVIYTTNDKIYGKQYGSGYCYYCTKCGAYVCTHRPRPRQAMGLLADARMRKGKRMCHDIFDSIWKGKGCHKHDRRNKLYKKLALELDIPLEECHFGYFDITMLRKAYKVLIGWQSEYNGDFNILRNELDNNILICDNIEQWEQYMTKEEAKYELSQQDEEIDRMYKGDKHYETIL